jgi:hypothetical protein
MPKSRYVSHLLHGLICALVSQPKKLPVVFLGSYLANEIFLSCAHVSALANDLHRLVPSVLGLPQVACAGLLRYEMTRICTRIQAMKQEAELH